MRDALFGRLLKAGIGSIAMCEGRTAPVIEEELGRQIGLSAAAIQRYKAGHLPPEPRTVQWLAEAAVRRGFLNREWLHRFLHAARYPSPASLVDQLCASELARPQLVRHNLPAPSHSQFVMRSQAFADVLQGLAQHSALVVVTSLGGMGKTSLAREVAAHCLRPLGDGPRFDAAVWVSDKDRPGTTTLNTVLDAIARTLDFAGFTQFRLEEKQWEVEQLLRRERVLVVVDNFETIIDDAMPAWLLRLPEPSKVIVTTRELGRAFRVGGWLVELGGMDEHEAQLLIRQRLRMLKIEHLVCDAACIAPLVRAVEGNPKAIEIALGCLKYEHYPLNQILADIQAARGELFNDLFARCWTLLDAATQHVLLTLALFPQSASAESLFATAGLPRDAFDHAIERLTDLALLDVQQADLQSAPRYALHSLVFAFATARLAEHASVAAAARERWVAYCSTFIQECNAIGWEVSANLDCVERESTNLHAMLQHCYDTQQWSQLIAGVLAVRGFWNARGYLQTRNNFLALALHAAETTRDVPTQVSLLAMRARTHCYGGDLPAASADYRRAQQLMAEIAAPDPELRENVIEAQIRICAQCGDFEQQLLLATTNVASAVARSSPRHVRYRFYIAEYYYLVSRYDDAEALFLALIASSGDGGDHRAIIPAWLILARIALGRQQIDTARQRLQMAHDRAYALNHRHFLAQAHRLWADVHQQAGDRVAARAALGKAIDLFERTGLPRDMREARTALTGVEAYLLERHAAA